MAFFQGLYSPYYSHLQICAHAVLSAEAAVSLDPSHSSISSPEKHFCCSRLGHMWPMVSSLLTGCTSFLSLLL
jgi:hypothetical protein